MEKDFLTKSKFAKLVEQTVMEHRMSYMEAVIDLCDRHDVDLEEVKKFISPIIKNKIEAEAMALNFLPQANTLPVD